MTLVLKFVGLALVCCIGVKLLAAVVGPAIPVLAAIFLVTLVVTAIVRYEQL
jgi:hypothetical protein